MGIEWPESSDDGGSALIAYTVVLVTENNEDVLLYHGLTNSAVMNDLVPGSKYSYRVKVTNAVADSDWSPISTFLIAEAPSPPINTILDSFDNTFVQFDYEQPLSTGGQAILGFKVYRRDCTVSDNEPVLLDTLPAG